MRKQAGMDPKQARNRKNKLKTILKRIKMSWNKPNDPKPAKNDPKKDQNNLKQAEMMKNKR